MTSGPWLSAADCNEVMPDHHYDSTIENLEIGYSISPELRCWQLDGVPITAVAPFQLHDDPDDVEGLAKIDRIRLALQSGQGMPPVIIVHQPHRPEHQYVLIEGLHRYNAAYQAGHDTVVAWVAHAGCCGGPPSDL